MLGSCKIILIWGLAMFCSNAFSQNVRTELAEGEYKMVVDKSMSRDKAEEIALRRARLGAIESLFGSSVMQHHTSSTTNTQTGQKADTKTNYDFLDESSVNGDWIADLNKPFIEYMTEGDVQWIHVKVKGRVAERTTVATSFEAAPLTCPERKCQTETFYDGQDMYLYFKAPVAGYVSVYLKDPDLGKTVQLLPYKSSKLHWRDVPVEADKEYIFFNKATDYFGEGAAGIDKLEEGLNSEKESEIAELYILFSEEHIDKPVLADLSTDLLTQPERDMGYTLPKGTENDKFQSWLQEYRGRNKKLQLLPIYVDVKKR